jgi:hypothetical protein
MKKLMSLVFGLGVLSFLLVGCEGLKMSLHESGATNAELDVPISKLAPAIKNAAPKAGLMNLNEVKDTPFDGRFESNDALVTYKKIDDKTTKIYIGIGTPSDTDKEKLLLNEIKKALGVK